jgi:hypothetical protein
MFREPFSEPNPDTIKMRLIHSVNNLDGCANKDEVRDAILRIQILETENDALRKTAELPKEMAQTANDSGSAYADIRSYLDDLTNRQRLREAWLERHPDHDSNSGEYMGDSWQHTLNPTGWKPSGRSTFDPNDPEPQVSDILTSQRFANLMRVAVSAYEKAVRGG